MFVVRTGAVKARLRRRRPVSPLRVAPAHVLSLAASLSVTLAAAVFFAAVVVPPAKAGTLPPSFSDTTVMSGLTFPTAIQFAPNGTVFVAEQSGIIKEFSSVTDTTPTIYADLRTNVHNYHDRGLLGLAVHPSYPTVPNVYALYAYDAPIGGTAPTWGTAGATGDPCPTPPGPTTNGCVISGRLSKLTRTSSSPVPYQTAVLADSPALYWRLGEASGTTASDASGNGRVGTYRNTPTLGQPGALSGDANTSVAFDGSTEYVDAPYAAAINGAQFTAEAWARVTGGAGTFRSVVTSRNVSGGASSGYIIYASDANNWELWLGNGSASFVRVIGPAVQLNTWTHLAATFDGTTARLYVNGVQAAQAAVSFVRNTAQPLRVATGRSESVPQYYFPGRVDEVAIYGSAVSAQRIFAHYQSGAGAAPLATETPLINDWCQQFGSESTGDLEFGADGALYATAGPGASFTFNDWGQTGSPANPCGDPPGGVGTALSPPTAEGGALRSQDIRTTGDPVTLDGALIRVNPDTGAAMPDNPLIGSADPNARRIIAYGLRNPFRMSLRPGTNELWIGDVGGGNWEEINRVASTTDSLVDNLGWPCYEGVGRQPGFDAANLNLCESLYTTPNGVTAPFFTYAHSANVVPGDGCPTGSSAISGVAFARETGSPYPASYNGALFFADYARQCIWVMFKGAGGQLDPATTAIFEAGAGFAVDLEIGPDGKLYWVDIVSGTIHRIDYASGNQPPVAVATGTPTSGPVPLTVNFNGTGSSDPEGGPLTYAWDLDGDGSFDDSTSPQPSFTYTVAGTYQVRLRVTDNGGLPTTSSPVVINAGNGAPSATITAPTATTTWKVGDVIAFSGTATDPQDGTLPASAFEWTMTLRHCPSNCHPHPLQTFSGVRSGSFSAVDHEYPSFIEVKLTVTDSGGLTDTKIVEIHPQTADLSFQSVPAGLSLSVNSASAVTPFTQRVILGSQNTLSAPSPQTLGGTSYTFASWSDGGGATHNITANGNATYTATYTAGGPPPTGYRAAVLADGPAAYWRVGEASGTTAADETGNGRTGTYTNTPTLAQPGALAGDSNTSVAFNGTNEYVQVPYNAALNPASTFSIEAWAFPTGGQGSFRSVMTSRDYSAAGPVVRGYMLYASSTNNWELWLGTGTAFAKLIGPAITLNSWTHIAATYDGTTARLYLNGTLTAQAALSYSANPSRPLRIAAGRTDSAPDYYFPGRLDEIAVYPTALTAARVQTHYQAGTSGGGGPPPAPTIGSFNPTSGAVGTPVTITGTNFTGATAVTFNGTSATFNIDSATSISTSVPSGATTGPIAVTTPGGTATSAGSFTVSGSPPPTGYRAAVLADAPAAYWRVGEASGTSAADETGNGRTGTYTNTPTLGQPGALAGDSNTSVAFDGTSEYVQVPYNAALNPASTFSIEAWAFPTGGQGTFRSVITSRDFSATGPLVRGYMLYASSTNTWELWLGTGTAFAKLIGPAVTLNSWTHIAATYDGTTARLYLNGTLAAQAALTYAPNAARPLRIAAGRTDSAPDYYFPGRLDEIALYPTALTAARIQTHYQAGTTP